MSGDSLRTDPHYKIKSHHAAHHQTSAIGAPPRAFTMKVMTFDRLTELDCALLRQLDMTQIRRRSLINFCKVSEIEQPAGEPDIRMAAITVTSWRPPVTESFALRINLVKRYASK